MLSKKFLIILVIIIVIGVGIGMFLFLQNKFHLFNKTTQVSIPISPTSTSTPTNTQLPNKQVTIVSPVDETANWRTYRNEEYGYEVKIPNDWNVRELSKEEIFLCNDKIDKNMCGELPEVIIANMSIEVMQTKQSNLADYIKLYNYKVANEIRINSSVGVLTESVSSQDGRFVDRYAFFKHSSYIYRITDFMKMPGGAFDQILSTFKFTK